MRSLAYPRQAGSRLQLGTERRLADPLRRRNAEKVVEPSFCELTQDGDDEGCFRLFELPTSEQAIVIRKALGLKRKRQVDPTLLLNRFQTSTGRPVLGSGMREDDRAGREVAADTIARSSAGAGRSALQE